MKKLFYLVILISSQIDAQFYEIYFETQVQTHYTDKGLKWFEEWEEDVNEREKTIEMNKNPPKQDFKFIYNSQFSKMEHQRKITNHQNSDEVTIFKIPMNVGFVTINDYEKKVYGFEVDVYGKKYLVKDDLKEIEFTDTGKTKELVGFEVFEAIGKFNEADVIVWYTKDIPYQYSPEIYKTTKGFILETHYKFKNEESEIINSWIAKDIKLLKSEPKIAFLRKGIEVKAVDVDAIYDEANRKRNEMYNQESTIDKK